MATRTELGWRQRPSIYSMPLVGTFAIPVKTPIGFASREAVSYQSFSTGERSEVGKFLNQVVPILL